MISFVSCNTLLRLFLMQRTFSSLSSKIIHCSFSSQEFDPVTVQWPQICVFNDIRI